MIKNRSPILILFSLAFLVILGMNFFIRDSESFGIIRVVAFLLSIGSAIGSAIYASSAYGFKSKHAKSLLTIALGMALIVLGNIAFIISIQKEGSGQILLLANMLYLVAYVFFIVGFVSEIRNYKVRLKPITLLTKIVILFSVVALGISIAYLQINVAYDPSLTLIENLPTISYAIFDFFLTILVLLIFRLSLSFGKGELSAPWRLILIGIILGMVGDVLYSTFYNQYVQGEWPYTMLNLLWVGGYFIVAAGFFRIGRIIRSAQKSFSRNNSHISD